MIFPDDYAFTFNSLKECFLTASLRKPDILLIDICNLS